MAKSNIVPIVIAGDFNAPSHRDWVEENKYAPSNTLIKGRNNHNLKFKFWRVPNRTIGRNTVTYSNLVVEPEESTRRSRVAVALRALSLSLSLPPSLPL